MSLDTIFAKSNLGPHFVTFWLLSAVDISIRLSNPKVD
jgi:hypothetical protein